MYAIGLPGPHNELYFVGIIDVLTKYGAKKSIAANVKKFQGVCNKRVCLLVHLLLRVRLLCGAWLRVCVCLACVSRALLMCIWVVTYAFHSPPTPHACTLPRAHVQHKHEVTTVSPDAYSARFVKLVEDITE